MKVFIPIAPGREQLARVVIAQLLRFYPEHTAIAITTQQTFDRLTRGRGGSIEFIDETKGIAGLTIGRVRGLLEAFPRRVGWYFQQFIKYQVSLAVEDEYYGVLDADTLLLRRLPILLPEEPTFIVKSEHHQPYFDTIDRLLGLKKVARHSYIAECMTFRTSTVRELMVQLAGRSGLPWYERVLQSIPQHDLGGAGFSEYETYGTYVDHHYSGTYRHVRLKALRSSGLALGPAPSLRDLNGLEARFEIATFERHQKVGVLRVLRNKYLARRGLLTEL